MCRVWIYCLFLIVSYPHERSVLGVMRPLRLPKMLKQRRRRRFVTSSRLATFYSPAGKHAARAPDRRTQHLKNLLTLQTEKVTPLYDNIITKYDGGDRTQD